MPGTADDNQRNSRYHGIAQIRGPITDPANSGNADPDAQTRVRAITDVRVARVETAAMTDAEYLDAVEALAVIIARYDTQPAAENAREAA